MAKNIEIELKFPLENSVEVIEFLNKHAKSDKKDISQKDTYYNAPHRDFVSVKYPFEWLRIRETQKGFSLDYKHFHPENVKVTDYCDEFETKVENVESLKKIMQNLNFKELICVDKNRSTWIFKDVEIAIDDVKELGNFIELELKKEVDNPKEGKEYLYKILDELNAKVGEEDLRGYPFKLLANKGYKFG